MSRRRISNITTNLENTTGHTGKVLKMPHEVARALTWSVAPVKCITGKKSRS